MFQTTNQSLLAIFSYFYGISEDVDMYVRDCKSKLSKAQTRHLRLEQSNIFQSSLLITFLPRITISLEKSPFLLQKSTIVPFENQFLLKKSTIVPTWKTTFSTSPVHPSARAAPHGPRRSRCWCQSWGQSFPGKIMTSMGLDADLWWFNQQ